MVKIAPSLLSADFARLAEEVRAVELAGADLLHLDVMDGHFVPNITFGPAIVKSLRPHTRLPFDVHLMIANPDQYVQAFADAGADIITVHQESCIHLHHMIQRIKGLGVKAGVAINPATPLVMVEPILGELDLLLVMSVNPGFGGQAYLSIATEKLAAAAELRRRRGLSRLELEVDGGIAVATAPEAIAAGADILVAGTAVFGAANRTEAIAGLKSGGY